MFHAHSNPHVHPDANIMTETQALTHKKNRENFEFEPEIDPKHYVKDKYLYKTRRFRQGCAIIWGLVAMLGIVSIAIYLIEHRSSTSEQAATRRSGSNDINDEAIDYASELPLENVTIIGNQTTEPQASTIETTTIPPSTTEEPHLEWRRNVLISMAREAWGHYERHAWGQDALRPLTKSYSWHQFGINSGLTIVTSMSTLWLMGLREEFNHSRAWVQDHLDLSRVEQQINVQHTVIEYIGSLLSCYALTKDELFLDKAREIADILQPAYQSASGLPYGMFSPARNITGMTTPTLSLVGGQHLEYIYLSAMTGDQQYRNRVERIRAFLRDIPKPDGLYLKNVYVEEEEVKGISDMSTLAKSSGHFYSYLMKSYVQSGRTDAEALALYKEAMDAAERMQLITASNRSGLVYARNYHPSESKYGDYMNYDACYLGAMLVQGSKWMDMRRAERHWTLADQLTETCHRASNRTHTGLPPHHFYFTAHEDATNEKHDHKHKVFHLSSELAESYLILWRMTRNQKWRNYAWELVESLGEHCHTENGFSNIEDVTRVPTRKTNYQDAELLAATLKYLYLIFADDNTLPLDGWIFNAFGQPLPICDTPGQADFACPQ